MAIEQSGLRRDWSDNRTPLRRACTIASIAALIAAALTFATSESEAASGGNTEGESLLEMASKRFPGLTRAERALLGFADKSNQAGGEYAIAGSSSAPLDPSNDPAHADEWPPDRSIRAELFRWLAVDNMASTLVDPNGVRVLGAEIPGKIDLAFARVPFALTLVRCWIPDGINLVSADLPSLNLSGSRTGGINGRNLIVHGDLNLASVTDPQGGEPGPFSASGLVSFRYAKIRGGEANFAGGHFHYSERAAEDFEKITKLALNLSSAEVDGDVNTCCGFESQGCTNIAESTIGGALFCHGARFINPGNLALVANTSDIKEAVCLGPLLPIYPASMRFESDGVVSFGNARVSGPFFVDHAKFGGKATEGHGFLAGGLPVHGPLLWVDVSLENGAFLALDGSNVASLFDEEHSWPEPGELLIDGFSYGALEGFSVFFPGRKSPADASSRLRWLALQPGFHLQPYRQLAKVLRESGDEPGAIRVLIAAEDERYRQYGWAGAMLGGFLKKTIGYGHRPLLTVFWMLGVIVVGWVIVAVGKRAGVMRPTWPENPPATEETDYPELHPLLYSLDVFLPFVNLHQERYFWPNGKASGDYVILGRKLGVRGSVVQYYLWLQIMSGWLLSAVFIAGVTGLIRSD